LETVVVEGVATGGQAGTSSRIENYLGFPSGISGGELADRALIQAQKFGARILVPARAAQLDGASDALRVTLADGEELRGGSLVVATGARYRRLDVPRLSAFEGVSVFYAATQVEAMTCRAEPVAVVGGGNSAGQAVVFLAQHAAKVWLLVRGSELTKDMSRYLADRIERTPTVEVLLETEVRELLGDDALQGVVVDDRRAGRERRLDARSLFVFIGAEPHTDWLGDQLQLDHRGFVLTGPEVPDTAWPESRDPFLLEASRPNVFAAGDVRAGSIKRMASAVGEGGMAVRLAHEALRTSDGAAAAGRARAGG
jgi:thioredoxin reductase (NADPH)